MTTARDIINSALRKIHVLGRGSSVSAGESDDALKALNRMVATWSVEGNMVYTQTFETYPLVSGQAAYTIGSGQDFDTDRVLSISSAYVTQSTIDYHLVSYNKEQYADLTDKTSGGIPEIFYFNADFPSSTIRLYPVPSASYTITLVDEKALTGFPTLDTDFAMPPEYEDALIYNLCVMIAPEYEREPMPAVMRQAKITKDAVKTQNSKNNKRRSTLSVPSRSGGGYNVYRGY